jgi:hypothetical protein
VAVGGNTMSGDPQFVVNSLLPFDWNEDESNNKDMVLSDSGKDGGRNRRFKFGKRFGSRRGGRFSKKNKNRRNKKSKIRR